MTKKRGKVKGKTGYTEKKVNVVKHKRGVWKKKTTGSK